ncbi:PD-(D/E)XK nuclease family protein [Saprospira grandis]|uniref:PD-(D/E)XK nuclease family protein n=1 Tax=Saprospira grandis TaxID=1008 RepID=UPI0022DE9087|nr:PD-(D/E)XK nuclease family protein [Saprospira grandis]WBM74115.1 PD-(D/E)XK nuclease family protein [Saprospira grandis]
MDINSLLKEFQALPKKKKTFLEICKYPASRFEEVCSRILCFYFSPKEEHGFQDLFLRSLFELLEAEDISFYEDEIQVIPEDYAEGKRLDIVITGSDFVIGIENKITASLYNPLDKYKARTDAYGKEQSFNLVLSVYEITKAEELEKMATNDFKAFTYADFFFYLKKNLGDYSADCNQRYLTHLQDFIETIENMSTNDSIDRKNSDFFFDNSKEINELISQYEAYKKSRLDLQHENLRKIKKQIGAQTDPKWFIHDGKTAFYLVYNKFTSKKYEIGIESLYKETKENALGEYLIQITTWDLENWKTFKERILKKYPNCPLDEGTTHKNRVYLDVEKIIAPETEISIDTIVSRLKFHFENLKAIVGGE